MKKSVVIINELFLSFGVAVCIGGWASNNAILHGPYLINIVQPLAAAIIWWIPALLGVWLFEALFIKSNKYFGIDFKRSDAVKSLLPLYLCYLATLQPAFTYFTYGPGLLVLVLAGTVYQQWRLISAHESYQKKRSGLEDWLNNIGDKWIVAAITTLFLVVYITVASATFAPLPAPEGDEPHYLVATYSMLTDGDIELLNNYNENDYSLWHEKYIQPHTKAGVKGTSQQFPMHNVGLSAYLVPFMAIGLAFSSKALLLWWLRLGILLLAAALIAALYFLLASRFCDRITAIFIVVIIGMTAPVLFYSYHVFTEIPVLLLLILSLQILLSDTAPTALHRFFLGLSLGALPWFGIKYLTLAASFVVFWIFREFSWGFRLRKALIVALPGIFLGAWFFITTYALFGTFNPAAYQFGADVDMFSRNSVIRITEAHDIGDSLRLTGEALLAYLIGQHQGLFFYAPWLLLGIAGLCRMFIRGGRARNTATKLLLLAIPFIVIYSISGLGGGHSPPGRTMIPILWLFILPSAWILQDGLTRGRELFAVAVFISVSIALALLMHPAYLYHDFHVPSSNLLAWLSTPHLDLTDIFPSLFNRHKVNWPVTFTWCLGIVFILSIWVRYPKPTKPYKAPISRWALLLIALLLFYAVIGKTPPLLAKSFKDETADLQIFFEKGNVFVDPTGFWVTTDSEENLYIVCNKTLDKLGLRLRSVTPNKAIIRANALQNEIQMIDRKHLPISIPLVGGFTTNGHRIIRITIKSFSGNPEGLALPSGDKRPLGVEVSLKD